MLYTLGLQLVLLYSRSPESSEACGRARNASEMRGRRGVHGSVRIVGAGRPRRAHEGARWQLPTQWPLACRPLVQKLLQHPPSVSAVDMADAEAGPEIIMESRRESLREDVRELLVTRNVKHPELADGHFFPDEVDIELDMLGAPVMYWILGHVDRGDIVAVDNGGLLHAMMELVKEVPEP